MSEAPPDVERQLELFDVSANGATVAEAPTLAPLPEVPEPPLHRVRRLSYSALSLFEQCSYRYFAERVVGLRPREAAGSVPGREGLAATELGDAVHALLEHVDLRAPAVPEDLDELVRARYPAATDEELARIRGFVDAYCSSELAARLASLEGAAPERPFAFEHDGVLLHGRLDVLWLDGSRALVVDYKTNALAELELDPTEVVERDYHLQRLVYALACFRCGVEEVEVVYQFLERPSDLVTVCYKAEEAPALEAELSAAIARINAGEFRADAERVHAAPTAPRSTSSARALASTTSADGPELRRRGEAARRPETGADPPDHRAARGRAPGCDDRAAVSQRSRAARLGDALGADDRRERQPRHRAAVPEVQAARGLPRRAARGARERHPRDRLLPAEGEGDPRDDADPARGVRRAGSRGAWTSCSACRGSRARRRTSSSPSAARPRGSSSTRTSAGSRSGSA